MLIGASIGKEDIDFYQPMFPGNDIMRIFPNPITVAGKDDVRVLQPWDDPRLEYCRVKGVIPFVSTKLDGYAAGLAYVKNQLINMPAWLKNRPGVVLYITDRHEPEGDLAGGAEPASATAFKNNFKAFVDMLDTLDPALRAKIWVGPILTKTWVEKSGTSRTYDLYDPMSLGVKYGGQFFAVDMYQETGTASAVVNPDTLTPPATFVARFKAYKYNNTDSRPRMWPELGLIGMPADTTGSARANWLKGLYEQVKLMRAGQSGWTMPWNFHSLIWWNQEGKGTGVVATVGNRRDFPLDERTVAADKPAVKLNPPLPLDMFNAIYSAEHSGTAVPDPDPGPGTDPDPGPVSSTPVWKYFVGATMKKADLAAYEPKLTRNGLMRIFPNPSDGLPPAWTDERFEYCRRTGATPFVSSNIDGDASKFAAMKAWIVNMPQWLKDRTGVVLYLSDRHEPENNFHQQASIFHTNYDAWWDACIAALPAATRAKVMAGPIVTRQWIEGGALKGNGNYGQYDRPLKSDFYAIDAYMDSWKPGGGPDVVAETYVNPVTFLAGFKAYKASPSDSRPRIIAELGAIGIPTDPTGSQRAAWINGICGELDTWGPSSTGWAFLGFAWWNNIGTAGATSLAPIGTARYFYLDKYQASDGTLKSYTDPLPLKALNALAVSHYTLVTGGGGTGTAGQGAAVFAAHSSLSAQFVGAPTATIPPPVVVPPTSDIPATGPGAARALQAIYTILVTNSQLEIVGDPLANWLSLQVTIRWKEPGSGQIVIPANAYVREQLVPGCRIVVLRRVLGTQHILIAGPMEQVLWERADDGENSGVGKMTVTFVDDLAWLGARLTYPDPDKLPEAQVSDFWVYEGNPEQAMLKLVSTQAGLQALPARQVPKLVVAPYSGLSDASVQIVGTTDVVTRERLEKVTDVLRKICTLGANSLIPGAPVYHPDSLGFRVRQTVIAGDPVLLFEPLRSRDLAGEVHFSFGKGNLEYFSFELGAPSLTHPIVGGQGEGSDRFVREIPSLDPESLVWGRFEGYLPEAGSDSLEQMQETATAALAEAGASARLASNATDTPDQRYGVHYNAGDIVSIELAPGEFEIAPVQTVALQAYPTSGETVGITIGDQSARYDSAFIQRYRELDRRLGSIERRFRPGA